MKLNLIYSVLVIALLTSISACKDDDETPIAGISFEVDEQEVTESDGTLLSFHPEIEGLDVPGEGRVINVNLVLDRAVAGDVVLKFDIDGTAREETSGDNLSDFEIMEEGVGITIDDDEITILKGTAEAAFKIIIFEDLEFEYEDAPLNDNDVPFETIELTLESVVSGPAKLGTELEHSLIILEDDAVAFLQWDPQDMEPVDAQVDMDMILWFEEISWLRGAQEGTDFEGFSIPAGLGEGEVGVSYTYYSGNSDDLDFIGVFFNTAGTLDGTRYTYPEDDPLVFEGNYKLVNINEWSSTSLPKIAQTMNKDGVDYSDISDIAPFTEGSRLKDRIPLKLDRSILNKISSRSANIKSLKGEVRK